MKTSSYNYVTLDTLVKEGILSQNVLDNISETNRVTFGDAYDTLITSFALQEIAEEVGDIGMDAEELKDSKGLFFDIDTYHEVYGNKVLISLGC